MDHFQEFDSLFDPGDPGEGGARRGLWGLVPQMGHLAPTTKHTGQESGGKLCLIQILIVSAVKMCKRCLQTSVPRLPGP